MTEAADARDEDNDGPVALLVDLLRNMGAEPHATHHHSDRVLCRDLLESYIRQCLDTGTKAEDWVIISYMESGPLRRRVHELESKTREIPEVRPHLHSLPSKAHTSHPTVSTTAITRQQCHCRNE